MYHSFNTLLLRLTATKKVFPGRGGRLQVLASENRDYSLADNQPLVKKDLHNW